MRLSFVVAVISLFGFIHFPLFAVSAPQTKPERKIKKTIHHITYARPLIHPIINVCMISPDMRTLNEMTQNANRALPNPCNPLWTPYLALSGGFNIDAGKWGPDVNTMGVNYQSVSVNDAYINLLATAAYWVKAFASVSVGNPTIHSNNGYPSSVSRFGAAEYSAAYSNNIAGGNNHFIALEQAYATIGDINTFPVFLQVGKGFQDFSRYNIHPITRSLTQVMSESLAISGKIGLIANGFHGSLYILEDPYDKFNDSSRANFGAGVGFDQPECNGFRWNLGVGYLYNLIGVNDIAYNVVNFSKTDHYHRRVGGTAVYADVFEGPFTIHARYTTAIQRFSELDLPKHGVADFNHRNINETLLRDKQGAKPWAAGIEAGYSFNNFNNWWCNNQNIYLSYQKSGQAAALNLPRSRWLVGYNVDVWKTTNVGFEWNKDHLYSVSKGGRGGTTDLVSLRAAVKLS